MPYGSGDLFIPHLSVRFPVLVTVSVLPSFLATEKDKLGRTYILRIYFVPGASPTNSIDNPSQWFVLVE